MELDVMCVEGITRCFTESVFLKNIHIDFLFLF